VGILAGPDLQAEGFPAFHDRACGGLGHRHLRQPNYYFQYDSQEFRDAYNQALKATTEADKAKWFARCQEIIADGRP